MCCYRKSVPIPNSNVGFETGFDPKNGKHIFSSNLATSRSFPTKPRPAVALISAGWSCGDGFAVLAATNA